MKKLFNLIFVLFCALVIIIPVWRFNWKANQISVAENRQLAELGSHKDGLSNFMKSVDKYVNDRIGFRDDAVQLYRQITIKHLNFRHKQVLAGEDGWLFFVEELGDYTGTNYSREKVDEYIAILGQIDAWCKERGIQFVFAVGPNKASIYSEYMPDYINQTDYSLLDALLERSNLEGIMMVCPKQELIQHKREQELYMRLDTHWNPLGARYMVDQLLEKLNIAPVAINCFPSQTLAGDLQAMMAIGDMGVASVTAEVPIAEGVTIESIPDTNNLIIHSENSENFVCYRDSFSIALVGYYTYYFNGPMNWTFDIDFDYVDKVRPKYLILECVERYIPSAMESNAEVLTWN